jgi:hypothetical protein
MPARDNAHMARRFRRVRIVFWVLLGALLALAATAAFALRPAALRGALLVTLNDAGVQIGDLNSVSYHFPASVWVNGLRIAQRPDVAARASDAPPLLNSGAAEIHLNVAALLFGRVSIRSIVLREPEIAVVLAPSSAEGALAEDAGVALGDLSSSLALPQGVDVAKIPTVRLQRADVRFFSMAGGRAMLKRRWIVNGQGVVVRADPALPAAYQVSLQQTGGSTAAADGAATLLQLLWRPPNLSLQSAALDLEMLSNLLPESWRDAIAAIGLRGAVRLENLVLSETATTEAHLRLLDLSAALPLEAADAGLPPAGRFLQVSHAEASILLRSEARSAADGKPRYGAEISITGKLNGATLHGEFHVDHAVVRTPGDPPPEGATFCAAGLAARGASGFLRIERIELPTHERNAALLESPQVPEAVRAFFADYQPTGPANFEFELIEGGAAVRGVFEPLGATCRYFRFPYWLEDIHGRVLFSEHGITLDNLTGRHGSTRIRGEGKLLNSHKWTGFDLVFYGENLAFDRDLYTALPEEYQRLWRNADPVGLCDVRVDISRLDGSQLPQPLPANVRVDGRLRAGSVALSDQTRLQNADASLMLENELLTIRDMAGDWRGAPVRVSGVARPPGPDGRPQQDVLVDAAGVPITRGGPIRNAAGEELGAVTFSGVGDVWATLAAGDAGAAEQYVVRVRDGRLVGFDPDSQWNAVTGWVVASQDAQRIVALSAKRERGTITARGTLPDKLAFDGPVELELTADDAEIERLLRALVPAKWQGFRDALGLSGLGQIKASLHRRADGNQAIDIELMAARMKAGPLPLDLTDVASRMTLDCDGLTIHECRARYHGGEPILLSGKAGWETGDGWARLTVQAPESELTPAFVDAMPKALGDLLRQMTARGYVAIALDPIELVSSERQEWKLRGKLKFRDGAMLLGVGMDQLAGEISGGVQIDARGEVTIDADLSVDSGRLDGRPIERWLARMTSESGDARVKIDDMKGYSCGGGIVGYAYIDPRTGEYELSMTLKDLSLAEFLKDDASKRATPRPGRLDGRVFLRGKGENTVTRSGGGELRIRGGSLLASSATRPLVEASRRGNRTVTGDVERADLRFAWEAEVLRFSRIELLSKDLRLIGTGAWNLRDDGLTMALVGASGENAPRLAVISDLLESASQELLQYRVDGTIDNPRVTVEPMHNLTEPLRRLIRGD